MIGIPPSQRGGRPADIAAHASRVAQEWEDVGEGYVRRRMKELGIPDHQIGQPDYGGDGRWRAFDPYERQGGKNTTGAVVDSGVLNPELLKGKKGGRIWPKMRLKDRIDAIIEEGKGDVTDIDALGRSDPCPQAPGALPSPRCRASLPGAIQGLPGRGG